jgi:hypothetical protein
MSTKQDSPKKVILDTDDTPDIVLPLVILIIFIVFFGWMLYLLISSGFASTNPENRVSTDNRTSVTITCGTGQCGTNLLTGIKTCPVEGTSITINPAESICNGRFVCDNLLAPFALQSDGSTNINGICEPGVECGCLGLSQCPDYILSVFTASNGNPYQNPIGQRLTFPQGTTYVNGNGEPTSAPPIQFQNPATTFCAAPPSWLPLSSPGCNFVNASSPNAITYNDIVKCMGMINGCDGFTGSPCLQGTLAVITDSPESINSVSIMSSQLGCTRGIPCPCGQVAIYDTNFGNIICRQLS